MIKLNLKSPLTVSFLILKKIKKLCSGILNKREINFLKKRYKEIFEKNLYKNNKGSIFYNLKKLTK